MGHDGYSSAAVSHSAIACLCAPLLVALTFIVYGSLTYGQYKKLMAQPPQPFTVLLPLSAPVVEAAPTQEPAIIDAAGE